MPGSVGDIFYFTVCVFLTGANGITHTNGVQIWETLWSEVLLRLCHDFLLFLFWVNQIGQIPNTF